MKEKNKEENEKHVKQVQDLIESIKDSETDLEELQSQISEEIVSKDLNNKMAFIEELITKIEDKQKGSEKMGLVSSMVTTLKKKEEEKEKSEKEREQVIDGIQAIIDQK